MACTQAKPQSMSIVYGDGIRCVNAGHVTVCNACLCASSPSPCVSTHGHGLGLGQTGDMLVNTYTIVNSTDPVLVGTYFSACLSLTSCCYPNHLRLHAGRFSWGFIDGSKRTGFWFVKQKSAEPQTSRFRVFLHSMFNLHSVVLMRALQAGALSV